MSGRTRKNGAAALAAAVVSLAAGATAPAHVGTAAAPTVKVVLKEWKVVPSVAKARPGAVTLIVRNTGSIPHELVVLRTTRHHHSLPVHGGQAVETAVQARVEELAPGQTRRITVKLRRGKHVLICNLPGHYRAGQYANLIVG